MKSNEKSARKLYRACCILDYRDLGNQLHAFRTQVGGKGAQPSDVAAAALGDKGRFVCSH
jgi:hypothetical protein